MAVQSVPLTERRLARWQEARKVFQIPEQRMALLLLLPSLLVVLATMVYPFALTIQYAVTNEAGQFTGLTNLRLLFQTSLFDDALRFTLLFAAFVVAVSLVLGLALALLVNSKRVPAKTLWITILIIPLMVSDIVSAVVWRLMYHPSIGILNHFLSLLGIARVDWLGDPTTAFFAVGLIEIWRAAPFFFLMLYAGLQLVPAAIYESAAVDGAGTVRAFVDMTLPYLRPVMTVALMLQVIFETRAFGVIVASTGGGPGRATWNVPYFIYTYAFQSDEGHFASAAVLVLVAITILIGIAFFRFLWVQRDATA